MTLKTTKPKPYDGDDYDNDDDNYDNDDDEI